MMNGPKRIRHWVTDFLASDIPTRLVAYRSWWGLTEAELPTPKKFLTYEPVAIDAWPMVYTVVLNTLSVTRSDYDFDENPRYEIRHAVRTYIWSKAVGPEAATDKRDDLTVVIRDALMDLPAVSSYDATQTDCSAVIDESTIREEFSDLTLIKGDRILAGAYIQYDVVMTETITREPLGVVSAIPSVIVQLIEKTPNAPTLLMVIAGQSSGEIDLVWKAPTWDGGGYPITGYRIEESIDGGDTWTVTEANTGSLAPTYTATGLTVAETYQFRVVAVNSEGIGAASASSLPMVVV